MPAFHTMKTAIGQIARATNAWVAKANEVDLRATAASYRPRGIDHGPLAELSESLRKVSEERGSGIY